MYLMSLVINQTVLPQEITPFNKLNYACDDK